jgi:Leucine-rich repeat (LRR) protein
MLIPSSAAAGRRSIVVDAALLIFLIAASSSIDDAYAHAIINEGRSLPINNLDVIMSTPFARELFNGCISQDNECGPTKGPCVTGECCSQFGWCGSDGDAFCGECCQWNCAAAVSGGGGGGVIQSSPSAVQTPTTGTTVIPTGGPKYALLQIYSQCNGRNWERKEFWASDTVPPCTWEGVTCSPSGDIIEISLRSNGLTGEFPTKEVFSEIASLTALSLEGNDDLMFSFVGVERVTNLESLDVSKTRFDSFDGVNLYFTQLKEVYAGRCGLTGPFPAALLDISRLQRLDLSFNHMTGELPADIGIFFSNIQVLFLHDNQFSGVLPESLNNMEELKYIQLGSNKFSGRVPSFPNAQGILGIDIRDQKALGGGLQGPIPTNFLESADGSVIQYINLSSNHINGELPSSLARIPTATMDFSDNEVEAVSPDLCGTDCALLLCAPTTYSDSGRQPSPTDNCSPCPSAIHWGATSCGASLPNNKPAANSGNDFETLKLLYEECGGKQWKNNENWDGDDMCSFWGITCTPTSGSPSVLSILLPSNNLKCTVPAQIFLLPNLQTLVLDGNEIEMNFSSIQHATSLATLSLADTKISSVEGINQVPSLKKLDITNNKFVGIPTQIFQISTLHELYLGPNDFNLSPIPTNIGALTELRLFECPSCQLNGKIPNMISALSNLVSLNLEGNLMTGPLPEGIEALQELSFLNLAGNYFDGELLSFRASAKLRRVDLSNNALSGSIPPEFMELVNSDFFEYLDLSDNSLDGTAPAILSRLQKFDISDNFITGLDSDLCNNACGCDCVLCGPGFYNAVGRQDSDWNPCIACTGTTQSYFGQTSCSNKIHSWDDEKVVTETISQPQVYQKPTSIEQEKEVLAYFYQTCAGDYWTKSDFWMKEDYGHCEWYGITCYPETGSVVSISLGSNNVQCVVQGLFDSLPNLSSLTLNSNPLKGFDFSLLGSSQSLRELNLDATGISSIEGIHHSTSLEAISLRFNNLRQIAELSMVPTLKSIRVSHNQLSSLPSFDKLQNLQTVIADNNNINGGLDGISFPPNLHFLDLSNNEISSVPSTAFSAVSSSSNLEIDLSENQIDSLPVDLCDKGKWNNGDVGKFGCNGLLCGKGYYSKHGRQTSDMGCSPCRSASSFLGATSCTDPAIALKSNPMSSGTLSFIVIMSVILCGMLVIVIVGVRRQRARAMHQRREDETVFIAPASQFRDMPQHDDNEVI